jgi:TP901 family phage tail tape measure protein
MADVQSNIQVSIDTTQALASIKNLQRQISAFHTSMAQSGAAANSVTAQMQQNLINSINATGKFSAQMRTIKTTTESFTDSLQKNKFSLGEYFRYAGGASKSFGRLFKTEFETINKVARENVKDLQTQYIKMGRDANGAMRAISVRPLSLDMNDLATKTMIASERQALLNQLLKQGSTNLLNFGKNTQWAGRQLMVGFTIPLMAVGSAAAKTFMDMETQAIRFKKVYGDLFTPASETKAALEGITELGKEFTKYGIAVSSTVGLAAEAAAAGFQGLDLQRQTTAATRLSILGQVESQKALETTIALQNAFSMSSENLAESIDFLNAVENQTVLSLDDMSTAIPKAAPVVQQLGGDVKDLAFLMTAMKEGGINASEGANALKSGLASLINPTGKANDMLLSFGINAKRIVEDNKGNLKQTVIDFASALNELDPLNRAQVIEQMFGKFQFARLSTLFANVTKDGTQAARVLDLAGSSVQQLASLSEKELGMTAESAMNKFKGAVENLKLSLVPVGEEFLKAVTPVAEFVTKILEKFNGLSDGTKKIIVTITAIVAGLGPVFLMTFGLLANGLANIIKGFVFLKSIFNKAGQSTATLGTEVKYMTLEQRNAAAVAASLDQVHKTLAQTFTAEASAVDALTRAYHRAIAAQRGFIPTSAPVGRGPVKPKGKFANGGIIVGPGGPTSDSVPIMASNGEAIISAGIVKKYPNMVNNLIAGNIPGFRRSGIVGRSIPGVLTDEVAASHIEGFTPAQLVSTLSDPIMKQVLSVIPDVGVSLHALSTTADGMVRIGGVIETSLKNLSTTLLENNIENVTAIGTSEFAGTTMETGSARNSMLKDAKIAGEPITFEDMQSARQKAEVYVNAPAPANQSAEQKANSIIRKQEAQQLIQEQLDLEKSLVGLSTQESELKKAEFTKIKTTRALEDALMQKGLSAEKASTLAKQEIAEAEKAVAKLTQSARTDLEKRKIKEAAYKATLLKEMGAVTGYDETKKKETLFNKGKLNFVPRDMAKGSVQYGIPYKDGEEVPAGKINKKGKFVKPVEFAPGRFFKGLEGDAIYRDQSALVDPGTNLEDKARHQAERRSSKRRQKDELKARAQALGQMDTTEYSKAVDGKTSEENDQYKKNRSKKRSAHPLAAQDGKDDAIAYEKARDKQTRKTKSKNTRQSGRARRVATRPQGPAPIGPDAPSGTGFLPMVAPLTDAESRRETKRQKALNRKNKILGAGRRMNSLSGGMGLLGANMAMSALPGFAGKGLAQGALTGANLGMMFGPKGMALGAGIGAISSAISELIDKQKQLKAVTEATFKSSADVATFFGNAVVDTTLKVGAFSTTVTSLSNSANKTSQSFGFTNEELARFNELIQALPENNPLKTVVEGLANEDNPEKINELAKAFVTTQVAMGQLKPDQAQKTLDLILASSGHLSMVGSSFINLTTQVQAISLTLQSAATNSKLLGDTLIQLVGAAANSSSLAQMKLIIDGIGQSGLSTARALDAMYSAFLRVGNKDAANGVKVLRGVAGITEDEVAFIMGAAAKGFNAKVTKDTNIGQLMKDAEAAVVAYDKASAAAGKAGDYTKTKAYKSQQEEVSGTKKQIDLLKKKKKLIDDQIKQQEKITNELKRQNDFLNTQRSLDQQIVEAKIKGNYIEAASLLAEKQQNAVEFNKETAISILKSQSDKIQEQIDALELNNQKVVDAINKGTADAKSNADRIVAAVNNIKPGSITGPATSPTNPADANKVGGPSIAATDIDPKTGERVMSKDGLNEPLSKLRGGAAAWKVGDVVKIGPGLDVMGLQSADPLKPILSGSVKITKIDKNRGQFYYEPVVKKAKGGVIKHFNPGGKVAGPGTSTSDSIPALLSDGEYVIKASSVAKYGTETMDALNAGRFAKGGLVPHALGMSSMGQSGAKKQNWFQRYVSSLSGMPGAEMFGTAALLRKFAGQSKKGDNLSAATMPLNFMGMGAGRSLFLGMPRGIKALEEARTAEQTMKAIDAATKTGKFKDLPITQLGQQLEATVGKSFPVRGIGGLYEGADGTKEFVKPVTDSLSGLSEIRSNLISTKVGLTTPIQDLIKILDPSDAKSTRTLLALKSAYNPEFANPTGTFTVSEYITQLVASLWRGDKDLQKANLSGKNLVDSGTSGVYDTASGMRKLSTSMPSMQEQAAINLLGVKGGAKRWFAETTAPIAQSMTPAQYHDAIIKEINRQIPLVEETIASFKLTDPDEIQAYSNLIDRLKAGAAPGVDWSPFQSMAASVVPAPVKIPTAAALAKKAEELELRKRQSGHAVGFSDLSFKERIDGYAKGGQVGGAPHSMGMSSFGVKKSGKKPNWFQRYVSSLSGMPGAETFGTAALLRKFAGQGKKGDNLNAALMPLNFMGFGLGARAGIGGAKAASAANRFGPNDINPIANYVERPTSSNNRGMAHVLHKGVFGEDAGTFFRALSDYDMASIAGYVRVPNPNRAKFDDAYRAKFSDVPHIVDRTTEARWSSLARRWKPGAFPKGETGPANYSEAALPYLNLDPALSVGESWIPDTVKSITRELDFAKEIAAKGGTSGGKNQAIARIIVDPMVQGLADFRALLPGHNASAANPSYTEGAIAPFTRYILEGIKKNAYGYTDTEKKVTHLIDEYIFRAVQTSPYAQFLGRNLEIREGKESWDQLLPIVKKAKGGMVNYKLPSYDVGSPYIPEDQIAQLHKGERVLTAQENKNFSNPGPVTNNITINGADKDPKQIAQEVMLQLDRMQSKNNKTNLVGR